MQLFGWGADSRLVRAHEALKGESYRCPECGGGLRVRAGLHRQPHFFHLSGERDCHQSGKSARHLQTQLWLERWIGSGELSLEVPFPSVGRVADAVWRSEGLIFEVQCSPISLEEVRARNRDYASEGYQVIWVLHDHLYNRRRCGAAETYLAGTWHYYADVDERGKGEVYDQLEWVEGGFRLLKAGRLALSPQVERLEKGRILSRWGRWVRPEGSCLQGDLLSFVAGPEDHIPAYLEQARERFEEKKWASKKWGWKDRLRAYYKGWIYLLVERASQR